MPNWRRIGLEGDVDGTSLSKSLQSFVRSRAILALALAGVGSTNVNHNVEGSIRGRVGYAWDRVLLYATGGVGFRRLQQQPSLRQPPVRRRISASRPAPRPRASAGPSAAASNMPSPTTGRSGLNIAIPISGIRPLPATNSFRLIGARIRQPSFQTRIGSRSASATSSTSPSAGPGRRQILSAWRFSLICFQGATNRARPEMAGFSALRRLSCRSSQAFRLA